MKKLEINERLEQLLKYLNINQKEFSQKSGISQNTISHAKKGKHTPNIEFFNSIHKMMPNINAQWLYMGLGEMFAETTSNLNEASKNFIHKISKIRLGVEECNEELEKAEKEISLLKSQVEDKNLIIDLLKNTNQVAG